MRTLLKPKTSVPSFAAGAPFVSEQIKLLSFPKDSLWRCSSGEQTIATSVYSTHYFRCAKRNPKSRCPLPFNRLNGKSSSTS